jgi:CheY-like chemotaxis protein
MNVFKPAQPAATPARLVAECQSFYGQAVAACLARLQRSVDLLQQPLLAEIQQASLHREIDDQTDRLNTLLRHMLAAGAASEPQPVALLGVITALADEYQALSPARSISLRFASLPWTPASAVPGVRLVFQLLLDNALRRTPGGQAIAVSGEAEAGGWIFSVHDAGAGLAPAQLETLFDNPSLAGPTAVYGLGLSLASVVVAALGGRMWAASEPGQGATFSFSLPGPDQLRRWTVSRPKILLIDKDSELCASLRAGYEEAGFEVETAPSAEAGLALMPDFAPSLVLLELSPASLAGQAYLAMLRKCSDAAVICLVASDERAGVPDALWQGATDCLVKPFHVRELIARSRAILRRRPIANKVLPRESSWLPPGLIRPPKINPLLQ